MAKVFVAKNSKIKYKGRYTLSFIPRLDNTLKEEA